VETAARTPPDSPEPENSLAATQESLGGARALESEIAPVYLEPDLEFIRSLSSHGGDSLKNCFQCGTCSATCALSPDADPFPRKEMAWAGWGLKDRLLTDPDVWLCHQCNDCSTRCPRGARPGDVLAAVRRSSVIHYAVPRCFGRWFNQARYIPLLLAVPTVLLGLTLVARDPLAAALGITTAAGEPIVYSYSNIFPHWVLNTFFGFFSLLVLLAMTAGAVRFWRALRSAAARDRGIQPVKGLIPSIGTVFENIVTHENFTQCTTARPRLLSHSIVFFGFIALTVVTIWVITARYNPLIQSDFVYPLNFWNPWKILANIGGAAVFAGCLLMIRDRLRSDEPAGASTYFDWSFIATLLVVVLTGFITEFLHYARMEPHRHVVYFVHLVFVFTLLMYLPYSKFAHLVYRTTAMVFAEYTGRTAVATERERQSGEPV